MQKAFEKRGRSDLRVKVRTDPLLNDELVRMREKLDAERAERWSLSARQATERTVAESSSDAAKIMMEAE